MCWDPKLHIPFLRCCLHLLLQRWLTPTSLVLPAGRWKDKRKACFSPFTGVTQKLQALFCDDSPRSPLNKALPRSGLPASPAPHLELLHCLHPAQQPCSGLSTPSALCTFSTLPGGLFPPSPPSPRLCTNVFPLQNPPWCLLHFSVTPPSASTLLYRVLYLSYRAF